MKEEKHFFENVTVTSACKDKEGGTWFSTLESGIYYAPKIEIQALNSPKSSSPVAIIKYNNSVLTGYSDGSLIREEGNKRSNLIDPNENEIYSFQKNHQKNQIQIRRFYNILKLEDDSLFESNLIAKCFSDSASQPNIAYEFQLDSTTFILISAINFYICDLEEVLFVGNVGARVTCAKLIDKTVFFGTKNGLFQLSQLKRENPEIKRISNLNITAIEHYGANIFAGTENGKLLLLKGVNAKKSIVEYNLKIEIECLEVTPGKIWIGTTHGLIIYSFNKLENTVKLTKESGLGSNHINAICKDDEFIYLAHRKGIDLLPININYNSVPPLINTISKKCNGEKITTEHLELSYDFSSIEFEVSVNSFRNAGKLFYKYKLIGQEIDHVLSESNVFRYTTLNPGCYEFEVSVSNDGINFGEKVSFNVLVNDPFWQNLYFLIPLIILSLALMFFAFRARIKFLERKANMKNLILELKASAAHAQMNPHFSSNVLNSIQSMIVTGKNETASIYLANFSRFLRKTLIVGDKNLAPIIEEFELCANYIELERLRFKARIKFNLYLDPKLEKNIQVPPMISQPLIENAILHGHKDTTEHGEINVAFLFVSSHIIQITVTDNGKGLTKETRTKLHESKGLKLVESRILILNKKNTVTLNNVDGLTTAIITIHND